MKFMEIRNNIVNVIFGQTVNVAIILYVYYIIFVYVLTLMTYTKVYVHSIQFICLNYFNSISVFNNWHK